MMSNRYEKKKKTMQIIESEVVVFFHSMHTQKQPTSFQVILAL